MNLRISVPTLKKLIKSLKNGMGHDGIHSLFLMQASERLLRNIVCFINACYMHCSIPIDVLKGDINPIVKDANGNITESNNYRPVMQSSVILKLIEKHILMVLEEKVTFNFRQFVFLKGCSTTDACLIMKEIVQPYIENKGRAYSAFIDLSKAFDKSMSF